jgi:hypothetical protein
MKREGCREAVPPVSLSVLVGKKWEAVSVSRDTEDEKHLASGSFRVTLPTICGGVTKSSRGPGLVYHCELVSYELADMSSIVDTSLEPGNCNASISRALLK